MCEVLLALSLFILSLLFYSFSSGRKFGRGVKRLRFVIDWKVKFNFSNVLWNLFSVSVLKQKILCSLMTPWMWICIVNPLVFLIILTWVSHSLSALPWEQHFIFLWIVFFIKCVCLTLITKITCVFNFESCCDVMIKSVMPL